MLTGSIRHRGTGHSITCAVRKSSCQLLGSLSPISCPKAWCMPSEQPFHQERVRPVYLTGSPVFAGWTGALGLSSLPAGFGAAWLGESEGASEPEGLLSREKTAAPFRGPVLTEGSCAGAWGESTASGLEPACIMLLELEHCQGWVCKADNGARWCTTVQWMRQEIRTQSGCTLPWLF